MGVDHGALIDPGPGVDVHGRHADNAAREVGAGTNRRSARNDAHTVVGGEAAHGVGAFVDEGKSAGGNVFKHAEAEAEQDALLDPDIDFPACGGSGVRRSGTDFAALEGAAKLTECVEGGGVSNCIRPGRDMSLNDGLKLRGGHSS